MATTTNYGWTTPDDTALVKDGASAIRTLGSSVDTTTKALNPSTTLGDIEYRSSTANTNTRLGIGTSGQVLSVSGGVPAWTTPSAGGGMTLISTTTLTGTSVSLTSIPQTYKDLRLYVRNFKPSVDGWYITLSLNGAGAANTYISVISSNSSLNAGTTTAFGNSSINIGYSQDDTTATGLSIIHIADYTNSTTWKIVQTDTIGNHDATPTSANYYRYIGLTNLTAAITEIRLAIAGSTYTSGTVLLYGVS
jgi:hypothetical protein